jgi:hypothetical protein
MGFILTFPKSTCSTPGLARICICVRVCCAQAFLENLYRQHCICVMLFICIYILYFDSDVYYKVHRYRLYHQINDYKMGLIEYNSVSPCSGVLFIDLSILS